MQGKSYMASGLFSAMCLTKFKYRKCNGKQDSLSGTLTLSGAGRSDKMPFESAGNPVVVFGATGGTGSCIVQDLLKQRVPVRVMSRKREKAQSRFGDAVEIVVADVTDRESLRSVFADALAVVYTVGVKPGWVAE